MAEVGLGANEARVARPATSLLPAAKPRVVPERWYARCVECGFAGHFTADELVTIYRPHPCREAAIGPGQRRAQRLDLPG
jgi:hypothetical protein